MIGTSNEEEVTLVLRPINSKRKLKIIPETVQISYNVEQNKQRTISLNSRNAHLVHQNWYRISITF
jgi:hypothetical protein